MRHPALPAKQSGKKEKDRQSTRFFFSHERRCHQALKLALNSAFTSAFFNLTVGKWAAQPGISAVSMGVLGSSTELATCCPDSREREWCNFWRCCYSPMWQANTWVPRHTRSAEGLRENDARHLAPGQEKGSVPPCFVTPHKLLLGMRPVLSWMQEVFCHCQSCFADAHRNMALRLTHPALPLLELRNIMGCSTLLSTLPSIFSLCFFPHCSVCPAAVYRSMAYLPLYTNFISWHCKWQKVPMTISSQREKLNLTSPTSPQSPVKKH